MSDFTELILVLKALKIASVTYPKYLKNISNMEN